MLTLSRGLLTAGLIAISTQSMTAVTHAAPARIVRDTAEATTSASWSSTVWVHQPAYGLDAAELAQHPEWQLRDATNNPLFVNGRAAADFGNADFRAWWIAKAQAALAGGDRGLYVDEVFMERRTTTAGGASRTAIDPRTGAAITEANWQKYLADFMVAVRAALPPSTEIVHEVLWYKGDAGNVLRQLQAADYVVVEGGFTRNVVSGASTYGFQRLASWAEREQARGGGVIFDSATAADAARTYELASYWLVNGGRSAIANDSAVGWAPFAVDLGTPNTTRYQATTGLWRRDFTNGIVLVNEPYRGARTVTVPDGYRDLDGVTRSSVTLAGGQGIVLVPVPPVAPTSTPTPTAPVQTPIPVSPAPVTPKPVAPVATPAVITSTPSATGDRAGRARAVGTAGAQAPGSTRVSVRGSRRKLTGRVQGATAGYVRVLIERKRGAKWAVARRVKVAVKRNGRFAKDIPTLPKGTYRVSGYFEGTGTSEPARSSYSTLR